uniref:Uncharacterized protein n=1 Tax=Homalodisca liturata TaxID=320908 RepID=A0A1B6IFB6_9HEMI
MSSSSSIAPLFRSTEEQLTPLTATVTGNIPEWLEGRYMRVGPGLFDLDDFTVNHWFDGFAVVYKFEISKNKVTFIKKYLQSDAYKKAMAAKRPVYTEFGTKAHSDVTKSIFSRVICSVIPELTDNCAVNIFTFNGQVFVSSESANIRQINPKTLETMDKIDLSKAGATLISSHFLTDSRGDMYTFATEIFTSASYSVIKVPASDSKNPFKKAKALCTFSPNNKGPSVYHSFAASDNYIVFIEQPLILNMLKLISATVKGRCLYECMEWQPHLLNTFYIIDKRTGKVLPTKYISTKPFFVCHHINCYEEDNQLVIDVIKYDTPDLFDKMFLNVVRQDKFDITNGGCVQQFVLPLLQPNQELTEGQNLVTVKSSATAEWREDTVHLTGHTLSEQRGYEQPCINPCYRGRKYRYFYASAMIDCGPLRNSLVKVDTATGSVQVWKESVTSYPGEPQFVPNPMGQSEEDGVLLVPVTNTDPAIDDSLVILDAATLKEIGRASITCHLPNLMHGLFISDK